MHHWQITVRRLCPTVPLFKCSLSQAQVAIERKEMNSTKLALTVRYRYDIPVDLIIQHSICSDEFISVHSTSTMGLWKILQAVTSAAKNLSPNPMQNPTLNSPNISIAMMKSLTVLNFFRVDRTARASTHLHSWCQWFNFEGATASAAIGGKTQHRAMSNF
ncbi:hypothetical protein BDR06DRAFT_957253 [Suillus hirtellus]|nr:hypothetical protein BDR06DRAFT_957253 [Suillus hirtellus]